jgi:hypothetical protein
LLLVLIPWSAFWDRNYFLEWSAALGAFLTSNYTRGAITGLGLINVWAAVSELGELFGSRKSDDRQSPIDPQSQIRNPQ